MNGFQYPWPLEIIYDRGGELLGHEFKNSWIEDKYGTKNKPASPGNPQVNANIERIHQVLGNLVRTYNLQETYVDDADPFMGILDTAAFAVQSTYHNKKYKILGQLVFGRDMILTINHVADWRYICKCKQKQINKYINLENTTIINDKYRVGDKVTTNIRSA